MKSKIIWACLVGITFVGFLLRIYHNLDISLWHDEAFSALLIKYPWREMIFRIGLDVHPPMYYIALRLWSYVFGDSLASLRGFSVFFGTGTILLTFSFVKIAFGKVQNFLSENKPSINVNLLALVSALLVAINPFQIQYATEARMYTFGSFLSLACAVILLKALYTDLRAKKILYFLCYGVLGGMAILTHYYLLFTISALGFFALVWHFYHFRFQLKQYSFLVISFLVTGLMFLPWLNWFFYQYKQVGAGYWIPPMDRWSIPTTLYQLIVGTGLDIQKTSSQILAVIALLAVIYVTTSFLRQNKSSVKWLVVLGWLSPFLGSLLFYLLAVLKGSGSSVYLVRYFSFAVPFFSIMLAVWLVQNCQFTNSKQKISSSSRLLLLLALIATNLFVFNEYWRDLKVEEKGGMKSAQKLITDEFRTGDFIVVGSSFEFFNLKYYLSQYWSKKIECPDTPNGQCDHQPHSKPIPYLYSGGQTTTENMPHFAGTAILTNADLLPDFNSIPTGTTVWLLWTNGFGGSKPEVPSYWEEISENGFAEVRPYVGTWIVVNKYLVK